MRLTLTLLILFGMLVAPTDLDAQTPKREVRITEHEADGFFPKHRRETEYLGDVRDGKVRAIGPDKRLVAEWVCVAGLEHGLQICYYPTGRKFCEGGFEKGKLHGEQKYYFPDGKTVAGIDIFKNGVNDGISTVFFHSGRKMVETPFVDGKAHGIARHYTAGTPIFEGSVFGVIEYENGRKIRENISKLVEVTAGDLAQIREREAFSVRVKDHWKEPLPAVEVVGDRKVDPKGVDPKTIDPKGVDPKTADLLPVKSIWRSTAGTPQILTILTRDGDTFKARFEIGGGIVREVTGTISDGKLFWLAKNVRAIKGAPGGDNFGVIERDTINFTWRNPGAAKVGGTFVLRRVR